MKYFARVCSLYFDMDNYKKPLVPRTLQYKPKHQIKTYDYYIMTTLL